MLISELTGLRGEQVMYLGFCGRDAVPVALWGRRHPRLAHFSTPGDRAVLLPVTKGERSGGSVGSR